MKHRPYNRLVPATLVSLSLVAATMAGGCSEQPSAEVALTVTTTIDRSAANPDDAPLGSDDLRENDTPPPPAGGANPAAGDDLAPPSFTQAQLEAMVAPIALYPDPLLMEILMAATYPAEVTQAAAWVKENPGLNGKQLDDAIADKRWDVSVNSLTHAPRALELLAADPRWMQDLGDAFLAQQDDVLNAVQVMRLKACDLGNLKTTAEQKVTIEKRTTTPEPGSYVVPPPERIVQIEPIQQDVVYVPTYNPQIIYGYAPPVHYYPTIYSYPAFTSIVTPVITFGVGLAIGGFLWGDLDWHYYHVYARPYYRDRYIGRWYWNGRYGGYNDFYRSGFAPDYYWRHDLDHRRGVRYVNRDVERFYSVRGRDPYRFRDNDYHYDRRKAARGHYDRMPGFRDGRGGHDGARGDYRDGRDGGDRDRDGRDRDGRDRDGRGGDGRDRDGRGGDGRGGDGRGGDGRGDSRDWREKARDDARQKMQRDSQTRGDRGPGGQASKDGDRGGDRGGPGKGPSADRGGPGKDSSVDRGGDKKGPPADRGGGKGPSMDRGGSKGPSADRGGSKGPSADRGAGGKGSSGDRGKADRPSGGKGGGGKVDRPSGGGGRPPSGGSRGPSMKQGGGGSSPRGGGSSKGDSVQRGGGGSSKGSSVQRGGGGGGSSKGSSVQRGGGGGGGGRPSGSSMRQGGGDRGGSSRGGGSQGGRSGGSSKGGGSSSKGGDRGKGGGRN